jgi:hypothetical protein
MQFFSCGSADIVGFPTGEAVRLSSYWGVTQSFLARHIGAIYGLCKHVLGMGLSARTDTEVPGKHQLIYTLKIGIPIKNRYILGDSTI